MEPRTFKNAQYCAGMDDQTYFILMSAQIRERTPTNAKK